MLLIERCCSAQVVLLSLFLLYACFFLLEQINDNDDENVVSVLSIRPVQCSVTFFSGCTENGWFVNSGKVIMQYVFHCWFSNKNGI